MENTLAWKNPKTHDTDIHYIKPSTRKYLLKFLENIFAEEMY